MLPRFHLMFGLTAIALATTSANAVEMGSIDVQSSLNEPFMAKIPLTSLQNPAKDIRVSIASQSEYANLGMLKNKAEIQYKIQDNGDGSAVLWLRSDVPINDPFLDLVLNVNDKDVSKQHKVSALINPKASQTKPLMEQDDFLVEDLNDSAVEVPLNTINAAPPPLSSVVTLPSIDSLDEPTEFNVGSNTQNQPKKINPSPINADTAVNVKPKNNKPNKQPAYQPENTGKYSVVRRDTLWGIATAISKEKNIPVKQLMNDILAMNRGAFINNNPNRLKSGVKLIVPSFEGLDALNARNANKNSKPSSKTSKNKTNSNKKDKNVTVKKQPTTKTSQPKTTAKTNNAKTVNKTKNGSENKNGNTKKTNVKKTKKLNQSELRIVTKNSASGSAEGNSKKSGSNQKLPPQIVNQIKQSRQSTINKRKRVNKLNTELRSFDQKLKLQSTKLAELEARLKQLNEKKSSS